MKILLTGATGYIAQRLLPVLLEGGHELICCVRDVKRFNTGQYDSKKISLIEVDFLKRDTVARIPEEIDVAFYLIHSMSSKKGDFTEKERICAENFKERVDQTQIKQTIYLSGIVNQKTLSKHLASRMNVESLLSGGNYALTTLRAGIIIGSGGASFEIIRDLVEKLPILITPKWVRTRSQPIAIRNVIELLSGVMLKEETYNKSYDIGGPEILTYKEMLLKFAKVRGLRRRLFTLPLFTPRLSSYWLFWITSTSYTLAKNLVNSMRVEVICRPNNLTELLGIKMIDYETAVKLAFGKISQNQVISSWKDAQSTNVLEKGLAHYIEVPTNGCFKDIRKRKVGDKKRSLDKIMSIGGMTGWYGGDWLWGLRGFIDELIGGVGMRRGRKNPTEIHPGEALDFWRVLLSDRREARLLLYAEMKVPGEAWLDFRIDESDVLIQTVTFRPRGVSGRLYWYAVLPFHSYIFARLVKNLSS
jgi:uncharacterized protein YbjT (DUF2867 family)